MFVFVFCFGVLVANFCLLFFLSVAARFGEKIRSNAAAVYQLLSSVPSASVCLSVCLVYVFRNIATPLCVTVCVCL